MSLEILPKSRPSGRIACGCRCTRKTRECLRVHPHRRVSNYSARGYAWLIRTGPAERPGRGFRTFPEDGRCRKMRRHSSMGVFGFGLMAMLLASSIAGAQTDTQNVDWPTYTGNWDGSRFKPLDQINASNFNKLEIVWRFKTDHIGNRPEFKLEGTPLEVAGVVYATAGSRRGVIALDAVTGELLWVHGEHEGARGAAAPRQLSGRGLSYWSDGSDARILYVTPGYQLIALDAKSGQRVSTFGNNGAVDLKADDDQKIEPDLTTGEIGWQSAPTVAGDLILIGSAFREGFTPASFKNNKGSARAYDVRTGKKIWEFHTIPQKGEPGAETWLDNSKPNTGNTGVWTEMTADPVAGLAYIPVEQPTSDFYGGKRPGNGLYGDSLV